MTMKRPLAIAGLGLMLTAGAAFAQATPPLNPPPTGGRTLNDGGTVGMTPGQPRANRNTASEGPTTTGSGNDNRLYNQQPRKTKRIHRERM
jgi:hypothetical protein